MARYPRAPIMALTDGFAGALSEESLESLARRFARAEISRAEWTHHAHLLVGAWHVSRLGPDAALTALRAGIRRLNEQNGVPNSPSDGYHESITRAYVLLLDEFLASFSGARPLVDRLTVLLESPLARRDVLLRFYSREVLMSREARAVWVPPDLRPLSWAEIGEPVAAATESGH